MNRQLSEERIKKIKEFNELCRLKSLMETVNPRPKVENVVVSYNNKLIDLPKG